MTRSHSLSVRATKRDFGPLSDKIIPISLREDVQVQIYGLPFDLTREEAAKIARVVMALSASTVSPAIGSSHRLDEQ